MLTESSITEAVDLFLRHPPYPDSYKLIETIHDDLERYEQLGVITKEIRMQLMDKLMLSHHFQNPYS